MTLQRQVHEFCGRYSFRATHSTITPGGLGGWDIGALNIEVSLLVNGELIESTIQPILTISNEYI
jgi:hypothetical protein